VLTAKAEGAKVEKEGCATSWYKCVPLKKNGLDLYAYMYVFKSSYYVNLSQFLDSESDEFKSLGEENCARFFFGTEFLSAKEFFSIDNVETIEHSFSIRTDMEDLRLESGSSIDARSLMLVEFMKLRVMACMAKVLEKEELEDCMFFDDAKKIKCQVYPDKIKVLPRIPSLAESVAEKLGIKIPKSLPFDLVDFIRRIGFRF
jgi:hypothetical protein